MVNADLHLDTLRDKMTQKLAFDEKKPYDKWKAEVKAKFLELIGMDSIKANACPLNVQIEEDVKIDNYRRIRFLFDSENGCTVPCYLIVPETGKKKYPLAITLQGHSTGFHNSIGIPKYERDENYLPRGAFGLQAVENGFVSLCIEQRGMGEQRPVQNSRNGAAGCNYSALNAFQMGRTLVGERIWDVSKALDAVAETFDFVDMDKVLITGNSGGGTTSYYAACFDERIKLSAPSCAFCSYKTSIMRVPHCACNYIPGIYDQLEMQDLACLIAPRRLLVIAGQDDGIFPLYGVKEGMETVEKIFKAAGEKDKCRLVVTPKEHWWCVDIVWPEIAKEVKAMGWEM